MTISKERSDNVLLLKLKGRLDTTTAPLLDEEITNLPKEITELTLDIKELEYVSSAGLRVILSAQKQMSKQGKMKVSNVNETILEVFEITGFSSILTIE